MDAVTEQAIDHTIDREFDALRRSIDRYIIEQESVSKSKSLALRNGYQYLRSDLVPEMLDRVISVALDRLTDTDAVGLKIKRRRRAPNAGASDCRNTVGARW